MSYVRSIDADAPDACATALIAKNGALSLWFRDLGGQSGPLADGRHLVQIAFTEPDDLLNDLGSDGYEIGSGGFAHTLLINTATVAAELVWSHADSAFVPI